MREKIQEIIDKIEESEVPFYEAVKMLKALVEPEKWEPKKYPLNYTVMSDGEMQSGNFSSENLRVYGNESPTREVAEKIRDMNRRNQLIMQAKVEIGAEDGNYVITYRLKENEWACLMAAGSDNPEITFKTKEQAEKALKMVGLND